MLEFAFKEVGLVAGAWDFGSKPPLEGGGILQVGLQYGAGVKLSLTPHTLIEVDFRETLSEQPDFRTRSHQSIRDLDIGDGVRLEPRPLVTHGPLRHQRISLGFGVAF